MGLEIKSRWILGGNLPHEPAAPVELGLGIPRTGLYLREDVDMKCNVVLSSFVKKTLKKAHGVLVDRLVEKAKIRSVDVSNASFGLGVYGAPSSSPALSFTSPHLDHRQSLAPSIVSQASDGYAPQGQQPGGGLQGTYTVPCKYQPYRSSYAGPPVPDKDYRPQGQAVAELPAPPPPPKSKPRHPVMELPA